MVSTEALLQSYILLYLIITRAFAQIWLDIVWALLGREELAALCLDRTSCESYYILQVIIFRYKRMATTHCG
jgi:hypothetical protein